MNNIEEKCKTKGVRLTDQRRIIAEVMSEATDHPDVDELHKRVNKIDKKKVSIAEFDLKNVDILIENNLLEYKLIKPLYLS